MLHFSSGRDRKITLLILLLAGISFSNRIMRLKNLSLLEEPLCFVDLHVPVLRDPVAAADRQGGGGGPEELRQVERVSTSPTLPAHT